jgi:hypothetical protein
MAQEDCKRCHCQEVASSVLEDIGTYVANLLSSATDELFERYNQVIYEIKPLATCPVCTSRGDSTILLVLICQQLSLMLEKTVSSVCTPPMQPSENPTSPLTHEIWFGSYRVEESDRKAALLRYLLHLQLEDFSCYLNKLMTRATYLKSPRGLLVQTKRKVELLTNWLTFEAPEK